MRRLTVHLVVLVLLHLLWAGRAQWLPGTLGPAHDPRAASASGMTVLGRYGGPSYAVAVHGHRAFLGLGARLQVLDISQPAQPRLVGQYTLGSAITALAVEGQHVYVAEVGRLHVLDVSTVGDPLAVAQLPIADWRASGLAMIDRVLYSAASQQGVGAIDVRVAAAPAWLGFTDTPEFASDLAADDQYLYVADHEGGLIIFRIQSAGRLERLGILAAGYVHHVAVEGRTVLVLALTGADQRYRLLRVDSADPARPRIAETRVLSEFQSPDDLEIQAGVVYMLAHGFGPPTPTPSGRLAILDPRGTRLSQPMVVLDFAGDTGAQIALAGERAVVAEAGGGLLLADVSDPARPTLLGRHDSPRQPRAVAALAGGALLLSSGAPSVWRIDAARPEWPLAVPQPQVELEACLADCHVTVRGGQAFVADYNEGLVILDVSQPGRAVETGRVMPGGRPISVAVQDDFAYLAAEDFGQVGAGGLRVVDISDLYRPREVASVLTSRDARDVAVAGGHAYVTASRNVEVIEVADPRQPSHVATLPAGDDPYWLAVAGPHLYVLERNASLHVFGLTDPSRPQPIGQLSDTASWAAGLDISQGVAYLADEAAVSAVDVSDPRAPVRVATLTASNVGLGSYAFSDIAAGYGRVYVTAPEGGLYILGTARAPLSIALPWSAAAYRP
jgi:hypothetical protein